MLLHLQAIEKDGRNEFVVLPYEEFLKIQEALEEVEDLQELRREREETMDTPSRRLREIGNEPGFERE